MKKITTAALLILSSIIYANAQQLLLDRFDEFEKVSEKVTMPYNYNGLTLSLVRTGNTYGIYVSSYDDLGCSGAAGNYLIFLFTDGTTYKVTDDISSIDCSDSPTSIFALNKTMFSNKKVAKIRFCQSELSKDYVIDGVYSFEQLIQAVAK